MTPRPRETCVGCGFDSELYDRADTISSQHIIAPALAAAAEGLDATALASRPDDATWSILEYIDHVRETVFGNRMAIEVARAEPGSDLGDPPPVNEPLGPVPTNLDLETVVAETAGEFEQMADLLAGLADDDWSKAVVVGGERLPVDWLARHVLHDGLHHLSDVGRIRHRLGHGASKQSGTVVGLQVSRGGVPKSPVDRVTVTAAGVEGDAQADRRHHGRPVQAVCLWSADVIESLQADGHPMHPGAAGENITVAGLVWEELRPGVRIKVGQVPMLITAYAIPCAKNAQWFSDRDVNRILHDRNPGQSRLYALPLAPGELSIGTEVRVGTEIKAEPG